MTERLRDAEARTVAQTVFDRPVVLEAGAGTGKTAALVARIVAWAVGPGWDRAVAGLGGTEVDDDRVAAAVLGGIVAITFTDDAAAEMARRVAQALDDLEGDPRLAGDHAWLDGAQVIIGLDLSALPEDIGLVPARAGALLTVVERMRTSTIHAFARTLVARFPVEAGFHPAFEVDADGIATADCVEWAVEELLTDAYRGDSLGDDALLLAGRGIGPVEIRTSVVALVEDGVPAEALFEDPLAPKRLTQIVSLLFDSLGSFVPVARQLSQVNKGSSQTIATAKWLLDLAEWGDGTGDEDPGTILVETGRWVRDQDDWKKNIERLKKWGIKEDFTQAEKDIFEVVSDEEFGATRSLAETMEYVLSFDPEVFGALRRILREVLVRVEKDKRRRGIVVFQDLLVGARRLLEHHPAVLQTIRGEITQLLVDEMQDTDADQAMIVRLLGLEGDRDTRPGLFLVGDPKQSIYGWRNADMAVYRRLVKEVEAQGGEVRSLMVNFRSVQPVLDEVTRLVKPVMDEEEGIQPPFVGLLTGREDQAIPDGGELGVSVEHWVSAEAGPGGMSAATSAPAAAELEAEAVARDAAALRDAGTPLREMAILMRSRGRQATYLEALRRHHVPYVVGKDPNYYRTREVTEMMALVRLILDPFDFVALVAVLRSPMVGVPDAALRPLWNAGLPGHSLNLGFAAESLEVDAVMHGLARIVEVAAGDVETLDLGGVSLEALAGWPGALQAFLKKLSVTRRSFEADLPDVFVENLRSLMVPEPLAASRFPGAYRLANIDQFLRELENVLAEGKTADTVLRHLRRSEREKPDGSSGRPRSDADGVRVLTIHGAKGLGFEHVWLVQTHAGDTSGRRRVKTAAEMVGGVWEMTLQGRRSPGYLRVEAQRSRVEAAEKVRLLYVALTRAKKRLVTAGNRSSKGSLSVLLKDREGGWPEPAELWHNDTVGSRTDRNQARWVWLGHHLWDAETPIVQTSGIERTFVDPGRIETDAEQLNRWIPQAQEHQQRPWLGTASEEAHRLFREAIAERLAGVENEAEAPHGAGLGQRVAMMVGTAMHGVLERFDHEAADPTNELHTRLSDALVWLDSALPHEKLKVMAKNSMEALVERFREGPLWRRFLALRGSILARELALIATPEAGGAVGAVTGSIDLVYRDPDTGEIVIADYKTDQVADDDQLRDRAAVYQPQMEVYARALREAMNLGGSPRRELWFLGNGVIHRLSTDSQIECA